MTTNTPSAPPRKTTGLTVTIVVLVVLVLAALGGVGYLLLKRNDTTNAADAAATSTAPASSTASTPPSSSAAPTSSAAPAGRTVTHASGKFTVTLPDNGWQYDAKGESTIAPGSPAIYSAPDLAVYKKGSGKVTGFAMVDMTGTQNTPEAYVASAKESNHTGCEWSAPKTFTYKDFSGTFADRQACTTPNSDGTVSNFDAIQLGVSRADGTKVGMVIRDLPGDTSTRTLALAALESIKHN